MVLEQERRVQGGGAGGTVVDADEGEEVNEKGVERRRKNGEKRVDQWIIVSSVKIKPANGEKASLLN